RAYETLITQHRHFKPSASTLAFWAGKVKLKSFDEGLPHDVHGGAGRARGFELPELSPREAAERFWNVAGDFTLFEHFAADQAAHERDEAAVEESLKTFDVFAREVIAKRPTDAQVLICSDHGNAEDLSTRSHTLAKVALLSFGAELPELANVADV